MSPWNDSRGPLWPLYAGIGFIVVALAGGFILMTGVADDSDDGRTGRSPAPTSQARPSWEPTPSGPDDDGMARQGPEVVSWGREGRQLAVVVRNDSRRVIDEARVRITARDAADNPVLSTTGTPRDVCCTIVGLPPGKDFGLFAVLDSDASEIADVEVVYVAQDTRPVRPPEPRILVDDPALLRYDDDTVAVATLTARGRVADYVAAQAILVDEAGDVAQVISGRFWCYEPGRRRQIRLHLFHPVPADVRLDRVVAYPIPAGVPAGVRGGC